MYCPSKVKVDLCIKVVALIKIMTVFEKMQLGCIGTKAPISILHRKILKTALLDQHPLSLRSGCAQTRSSKMKGEGNLKSFNCLIRVKMRGFKRRSPLPNKRLCSHGTTILQTTKRVISCPMNLGGMN